MVGSGRDPTPEREQAKVSCSHHPAAANLLRKRMDQGK